MNQTTAAAMSGGVDSTAAALLLLEGGHRVEGVTLRLAPCGQDGTEDARAAARTLNIPHHVFDLTGLFQEKVVSPFVQAYETGRTPNPCVLCNREIKFGALLELAREWGWDKVATGHYARLDFDTGSGRWLLKKGESQDKDQSYVLYNLTQDQLSRLLLPLGGLTKAQVRQIAEQAGLANAQQRESQDICFVPDGDYAGFIERYTGQASEPGDFVGTEGQVYGRHKGIIHYTLGQRKGLGISFPQPMYVCRIDPRANQVVLAERGELSSCELVARDINLISVESIEKPIRVWAKARYRHREQPAEAVQIGPDRLKVTFEQPQRAITPGQSVVLYDWEDPQVVVGGGVIC